MTKILLVEDDKSLREIYGVRLLAEGYDIVSAGDGEEALAMAIKERPHLIVSDVMMPKISGFDMLDILRSTTETKNIKVIMMTALSSDDQRQRGEQLGADRYLVKSQVGIEDVVRTVHEVLEDAPVARPAFETTPKPATSPQQQQPAPSPAPETAPRPTQPQSPQQQQQAAPSAPTPSTSESAPSVAPQVQFPPQPTAPFASPRPATLGERVIQPLDSNTDTNSDALADRIAAELSQIESSKNTAPTQEQMPSPSQDQTPVSQPQPQQPVVSSRPPVSIPINEQPQQQAQATNPAPQGNQTQMTPPSSNQPPQQPAS